jgi:hypothetical protein
LPSLHFACVALAPVEASAQAPGAPAPVFTLPDIAGNAVKLAEFRGSYVVLEWTNPECPFVGKHYLSRDMQDRQKAWSARDVVWLSIKSTNERHSEWKTPPPSSLVRSPRDPRRLYRTLPSTTASRSFTRREPAGVFRTP